MDAAGDSITKAFDADQGNCTYDDQEWLNWATSDTHGIDFCSDGGDGVFSHAEMLECFNGMDISVPYPNAAESGAQMLKDFVAQAIMIQDYLANAPAPRYATVFLGHNDICGGTIDKVQAVCDWGDDQDPNNYCRTTPEAFEREFRKGLDILIVVPDLTIGVASLVRVSQLCNHAENDACGLFFDVTCQQAWTAAVTLARFESGICGSLTFDCSDERIVDAYTTAQAYHEILARVTAEYAAIPVGDSSDMVTIGGQTVGGAPKAAGVTIVFSDTPWVYTFSSEQLSCCDCFHPSILGQDTLARLLFQGLNCSAFDPCIQDIGDPLTDALGGTPDTSGTYYPGFF
jgi:hypothetical protein